MLEKKRVAENTYAETAVKIGAVEEELLKAQNTQNKLYLEICTKELRMLQLKATQNKAVVDYQKSLSDSQLHDLDFMKDTVLSSLIKSGSIKTFRGVIADTTLRDIERASLSNKSAFNGIHKKMEEKLEELKAEEAQYKEHLEETEEVEY